LRATEIVMPTLLRESVLLEPDRVRILDCRIFPFEHRFVNCGTYEEVAIAIEDMVTRSNGPFCAAGAALVLAAPPRPRAGLQAVRTGSDCVPRTSSRPLKPERAPVSPG
jgi:methylthioribose-1-phosphate isomerase